MVESDVGMVLKFRVGLSFGRGFPIWVPSATFRKRHIIALALLVAKCMKIGQGHVGPEDQRVLRSCDMLEYHCKDFVQGCRGCSRVVPPFLIFDLRTDDP